MGQTVIEKIVQQHLVGGPESFGRLVRTGDFVGLRPRHVMTHDNTAAVMNKFRAIGASAVADSNQPVFALDHDIQNRSEGNLRKYANIEAFAGEMGVTFYPAGCGIGHQQMLENGHVTPGSLVVASDSHSNMYGSVGALGTPVVRTDAAAIWAVGEFWWQIPRTIQVVLNGELRPGVSGKDLILALCAMYNEGEALNAAIEFAGPGVASLSMDARMAVSNMTTEWGALVGWFPVDDVTIAFYEERVRRGVERVTADDIARWREAPIGPDGDAVYAARITVDLAEVTPHVAGPDYVQVGMSIAAAVERDIPVHRAYLLSCVNSRVEDLAAAADVLRGEKIADGVDLYIAAASQEVEDIARERGDWQVLLDAGATALPPSCGPCIGLGTGLLEAGENGISATNRNFKGRMGSRDAACYLGSPRVVAASALAGRVTAPETWADEPITRSIEVFETPAPPAEGAVEILDGFPEKVVGRLVFLPEDNLNTDGIYGKDYTYREDMSREDMARVVMENYDPEFSARTQAGDVIVGAYNFGTGSSREQAVTALQAKGLPLVIAGTFSQTYLRNAFNNGFLCIANAELVDRLRGELGEGRTLIPGDEIVVDFRASTITWRGDTYRFPALGPVPQALVIAGGVENQVKERLGI